MAQHTRERQYGVCKRKHGRRTPGRDKCMKALDGRLSGQMPAGVCGRGKTALFGTGLLAKTCKAGVCFLVMPVWSWACFQPGDGRCLISPHAPQSASIKSVSWMLHSSLQIGHRGFSSDRGMLERMGRSEQGEEGGHHAGEDGGGGGRGGEAKEGGGGGWAEMS